MFYCKQNNQYLTEKTMVRKSLIQLKTIDMWNFAWKHETILKNHQSDLSLSFTSKWSNDNWDFL